MYSHISPIPRVDTGIGSAAVIKADVAAGIVKAVVAAGIVKDVKNAMSLDGSAGGGRAAKDSCERADAGIGEVCNTPLRY